MITKCRICSREMFEPTDSRAGTDAYFTKEHIFPASIGGTWVRNDLICKRCNSESGNSIDVALLEVLNPISIVLNVRNSRSGNHPTLDFEADGKKYRVLADQAQLTNLKYEKPTLSDDGSHIYASGPRGSEAHLDKSLKGFAKSLGWDTAKLEKSMSWREYEEAPLLPIKINIDISKENLKLAIVKIAYLSLHALATADQVSAINLDFVRSRLLSRDTKGIEITLTPDGTRFLNRYAHGAFVHILEDAKVGVQLFFYGALTVLVKFPVNNLKALKPFLKGVIIYPKSGEMITTDNPNFSLGEANPELGYAALDQMMKVAIREGELLAALRRAWLSADLNRSNSFYSTIDWRLGIR
jgi:HNH endonuclease